MIQAALSPMLGHSSLDSKPMRVVSEPVVVITCLTSFLEIPAVLVNKSLSARAEACTTRISGCCKTIKRVGMPLFSIRAVAPSGAAAKLPIA